MVISTVFSGIREKYTHAFKTPLTLDIEHTHGDVTLNLTAYQRVRIPLGGSICG